MVDLVACAAAFVARTGLPPEGALVVAGCSGGADSTALLLALTDLRVPVHAVYIDHGLRPGTDDEARTVAAFAARADASFEAVSVHVSRAGNLLANARDARYAALAACARRKKSRFVAVGHTGSDQAETVAFRTQRGDVPHALAGMPLVRRLDESGDVLLLRPLLEVHRSQTAAFVAARGLVAVADPSNEKREYLRVRLRAELAADPALHERFLDEAAHARARLDADDVTARTLGPLDSLDAHALSSASEEVLLRLLRRAGVHRAGRAHARALAALASSVSGSRHIDLGAGLVASRTYDRVGIGTRAPTPDDVCLPVAGPGRYYLLGRAIDVELVAADHPAYCHALDVASLPGCLDLRNVRAGDRLRGRGGGRKLQDVLIDRKVPRDRRRHLPMLAAAGGSEVFWIDGLGVAPGRRAMGGPGLLLTSSDGPSAEPPQHPSPPARLT